MDDIEAPLMLEEIVKKKAKEKLDSKQKQTADLANPVVDWERMYVTHGETMYEERTRPPLPRTHVLLTANFSNNTPSQQSYRLCTERHVESTCSVVLKRTFTRGGSIQVKLMPPNPIISAAAGFRGEMTMEKDLTRTFRRELAWTVDNQILVPAGHVTRADLEIKEDEFVGDFTVRSTFHGQVAVKYETKSVPREHVETVVLGVKLVFTKDNGFEADACGRPVFVTRGSCKCRFGIEQNVRLTEVLLGAPPAEVTEAGNQSHSVDVDSS